MTTLAGKTALITGGGGGIGRAAALEMVRRGVRHLAVVDLNEKTGRETAHLVEEAGAQGLFIKADVRQSADVQNYVQKTVEAFERIDIFFNNAGHGGHIYSIMDYPEEDFDLVIAVNVKGVFLGMKYVLPVMLKQGSGSVINTASVAGLKGPAKFPAYVASKHAVIGLTRAAANDMARKHIRVNAICPSYIETDMVRDLEQAINPADPGAARQKLASQMPYGRYGTLEEVAAVVAFLASDEASYLNGLALPIDGGLTAF